MRFIAKLQQQYFCFAFLFSPHRKQRVRRFRQLTPAATSPLSANPHVIENGYFHLTDKSLITSKRTKVSNSIPSNCRSLENRSCSNTFHEKEREYKISTKTKMKLLNVRRIFGAFFLLSSFPEFGFLTLLLHRFVTIMGWSNGSRVPCLCVCVIL